MALIFWPQQPLTSKYSSEYVHLVKNGDLRSVIVSVQGTETSPLAGLVKQVIIETMMINDNHQLIIGIFINIIKKTALFAGYQFYNVDHYGHGTEKVMIIKNQQRQSDDNIDTPACILSQLLYTA